MEVKEMTETKKGKKVVIQSIGKEKFSGLAKYPKTKTVLTVELGPDGAYKTGLTSAEERQYEELLQLPHKALAKKHNDIYKPNFWSELEIHVMNKKVTLDLEDPMDYLKYKACLESSKVCNSELERFKWPSAEFIIIDEEDVANKQSIEIDSELEAMEKFANTTVDEKRGILKLYGKTKTEDTTESIIRTTLYSEMKKDPKRFLEIINDKNMKSKIFLKELLTAGIIRQKGNYFTNGDDPIGNSTDEVVHFLNDKKNTAIVEALKSKLKSSK